MSRITSFPIPRLNEDLEDEQMQNWIDDITKYLFDLNTEIQNIVDSLSGVTATQTFKDGSGATKTMTITNGRITNIA